MILSFFMRIYFNNLVHILPCFPKGLSYNHLPGTMKYLEVVGFQRPFSEGKVFLDVVEKRSLKFPSVKILPIM